MKPKQFNDHVHTEVTVTVPLTIRAFTNGKSSLSAVSELLAFIERKLELKDDSNIEDWYYWDKVWPVELHAGEIKNTRCVYVSKLDVPEEVPGEAEA